MIATIVTFLLATGIGLFCAIFLDREKLISFQDKRLRLRQAPKQKYVIMTLMVIAVIVTEFLALRSAVEDILQ